MRKFVLVALSLVAIVIILIAGVRAYEFWTSLAQDRCTFGTISNDRYREWLAKAGALRERVGPLISSESVEIISGSGRKSEYANNIRFTQLSSGVESIDERIAIVHAMLRAEGFQIRAVLPDSLEPFERAQTLIAIPNLHP